ncbi:MAG TPA: hypothetical protein VD971_04230 [Phycisphaerales bacterium]|nr:hypothetical protein [Phycisphaerales bacterium]
MKTRPSFLVSLFVAAASCAALGQSISWEILKPSNTGIPGDFTQTILIDGQQRPWVAGYIPFWEEGGVAYRTPDGDWTPISSVDHPEIASPRFSDMKQDAAGNVWVASDDGILRIDSSTTPATVMRFGPQQTGLPATQFIDIDIAPDGSIWAVSDPVQQPPTGGMVRYRPATNQWTAFTVTSPQPNRLPWAGQLNWNQLDRVAVHPDETGGNYTVYFAGLAGMGSWRDGVMTWVTNSQTQQHGSTAMLSFPSVNAVSDDGTIWYTSRAGLVRKPRNGPIEVVQYPNDLDTEVSLVTAVSGGRALLGTYYADVFLWNNGGWSYLGNWGSGYHTYAFAEEAGGAFWAGGIGGSSRYDPNTGFWQRYRLTNTGMLSYWVESFTFDTEGNVYMNGNAGTGVGGFNIYDGRTWVGVNVANYGLGPPYPLNTDDTSALQWRSNNTLAVAGRGQGLYQFDGFGFTELIAPGFADIIELAEDGSGRLWGSHYGGGVHIVDQSFQRQFLTRDNSPLTPAELVDILPDPQNPNFVYICGMFAVQHTDGVTWQTTPREALGLFQNSIGHHFTSMGLAPDGMWWLGSGQGLFHYNPQEGTYTRYHKGNTPGMPSDDVWHIEVAPDGSVWFNMFDDVWPYPGGMGHVANGTFTFYRQGTSPLPHNQVWGLNSRAVEGGYELWIGTASEGVAVVTVSTPPAGCDSIDYNNDGLFPDNQDLEDFLSVFGGGSCSNDPDCGDIDFNNDGLFPDNEDINAFFAVFGGGDC